MTDFLPEVPIDDDARELVPQGNGQGQGQLVPTETKIGDIVSMRRAAVLLPRQPRKIRDEIAEMAELFGDEWDYKFPVRNNKTGETEFIEGPTVGCAMSVARAYGNCDVAHTRTDDERTSWILYSTFVDLQSGFSLTRGFRQRKGQSRMGSDRARGEDIDFQIGVSKSTRNVVVRALDDYVRHARQCAKARLVGAISKRADEYRERIEKYLEENGPTVEGGYLKVVEGAVGGKIEQWSNERIATVVRVLTAHRDGILRDLDEVYRPKAADIGEVQPQAEPTGQREPVPTTAPGRITQPQATEPESDAGQEAPRSEGAPAAQEQRKSGRRSAAAIFQDILGKIRAAGDAGTLSEVVASANSFSSLTPEMRRTIKDRANQRLEQQREPDPGAVVDPEIGAVAAADADTGDGQPEDDYGDASGSEPTEELYPVTAIKVDGAWGDTESYDWATALNRIRVMAEEADNLRCLQNVFNANNPRCLQVIEQKGGEHAAAATQLREYIMNKLNTLRAPQQR